MAATFLDIAITPDVMDVQHEMGSDSLWQTPHSRRQADRFGDSEAGMIATRDRPWRSSACAAPTATLLHRQKPLAWAGVAWWPGGRTAQNALRHSPRITRSVASTTAPAA